MHCRRIFIAGSPDHSNPRAGDPGTNKSPAPLGPTVGLPELIGVDNGSDFRSATFRRACENEGIRVEFRPPGRPHYGGHIERLMGTMMKDVHALPGTTFSCVTEGGRQDPAKSAGLTLHELETYFAIEIVEGYHPRIHRGLQRAPIAWREFVGETPLRMPRDRVAFWVSFLPEARRKLRPDGVHMFGSLKYWPSKGRIRASTVRVQPSLQDRTPASQRPARPQRSQR